MREKKYGGLAAGERGQAIVEFALILPVLMLLLVGIVEFSMLLNARNIALFASRDGSMLAAEGGSRAGTDCVVLLNIERDLAAPTNATRVTPQYSTGANGLEVTTWEVNIRGNPVHLVLP